MTTPNGTNVQQVRHHDPAVAKIGPLARATADQPIGPESTAEVTILCSKTTSDP
jgi:hypothetical protein